MNILTGELPNYFEEYEIQTDFREWCKYEQLMADDSITPMAKIPLAVGMLFVDPIPNDKTIDAFEFIQWFYRCGNEPVSIKGGSKRYYDYEADGDYIYSAFLSQYGIDLIDTPYLHWWKFSAMLKSLTECKFTEIIGFRCTPITTDMPKEKKESLKKLKAIYALPKSVNENLQIAKSKEYYGR